MSAKFDIIIDQATSADADEYIALEKKVGGRTYAALTSKEQFLNELEKWTVYLFKKDGKVIGHISYQVESDGGIRFGGLAIEPELQGKGFGRAALELIVEKIKDAPKVEFVVHPDNLRAIELYKSFGAKIVGRKENCYGDGEPRIIMIKNLTKMIGAKTQSTKK
jgi:ribosomal protein S18 acetylase RimI-like enzyme